MVIRTYLDKFATIVKDSKLNSGLNPVGELHYGKDSVYSRLLVHFDHNKIKDMVDDKTFADRDKLRHTLHIINSGGLDFNDLFKPKQSEITNSEVKRACSFDLIFFLIPQEWDNGKGYDMTISKMYISQDFNRMTTLTSEDGCNWFQPRNGYSWTEEGVYSNDTLSREYNKFGTEDPSDIIFARQHFDIGDEDISIDITDIVNKFLDGEKENYGIGIAFTPMTEMTVEETERFCGFFSPQTHTFFNPYVETTYDDYIKDDRGNFTLGKTNHLYFYANIDGIPSNLDETPICEINGIQYNVKQFTKGIYYADIFGDKSQYSPKRMYHDVWSNLKYQGETFDEVEMDFVVHGTELSFQFGNGLTETKHCDPVLSGIHNNEKIFRNGDTRRVNITCRKAYERNKVVHPSHMTYRLYVLDGTREYTVCSDNVNIGINEEWFNIDVNSLNPNKYYVDVTIQYPQEKITYRKCLEFFITNNAKNEAVF